MNFSEFFKKKVFSEFNDKADKVFVRSVATSIFALVICIIIFSATSFAWFSDITSAGEQVIQSSNYALSITALGANDDLNLAVELDEHGNKIFSLVGGQKYEFTVTTTQESNGKTGYIKLQIGNIEYYSDQIDNGTTFTFSMIFTNDTKVTIIERWGISSIPDDEREINNNSEYLDMAKNK